MKRSVARKQSRGRSRERDNPGVDLPRGCRNQKVLPTGNVTDVLMSGLGRLWIPSVCRRIPLLDSAHVVSICLRAHGVEYFLAISFLSKAMGSSDPLPKNELQDHMSFRRKGGMNKIIIIIL